MDRTENTAEGGSQMSVDAKIKAILGPFGDPVERSVYQGKAKRYYTFSYTTLGISYADDAPQYERYLIQIHFFAPLNENVLKRIKETKQALFKACFSFPETTDTSDEDVRHIVFECETTEDLAEYGDDYN